MLLRNSSNKLLENIAESEISNINFEWENISCINEEEVNIRNKIIAFRNDLEESRKKVNRL